MHEMYDEVAWARRLKVRHLNTFLTLSDSSTLTDAAARMHMTQSAMSHWLSELESLTGVSLVTRGKRMQLTPAGHAVKRLAVRVLGDISRTHEEISSIKKGRTARLHVGSVSSGITHLVPQSILRFQQGHPKVAVQTAEGPFNTLLDDLEKRELDVVVGPIDARAFSPRLRQQVLFEDRIVAVSGRKHPLRRHRSPSLSMLTQYPWVMPPHGTLMRSQLDAALLEHGGAAVVPRVETASLFALQTLLAATDYIGICSEAVSRHIQALGLLHVIPLVADIPFAPIGTVWREDKDDEITRAFLNALRGVVREQMEAPE